MNKVFCSLGSNLGNKIENLQNAIKLLNSDFCSVIRISSFYETLPMGDDNSQNYINAVIEISTEYNPLDLFNFVKSIEKKLGRETTYRWGPRVIDIDILLFNDLVFSDSRLKIPHIGLTERDFVLLPLLEIAGDIKIPSSNITITECIKNLQNRYILRKI